MQRNIFKKLRPGLIMFFVSIIVTVILSIITYEEGKFLKTMSNNFFIVGTVYMTVGIIFEIISWSSHKKHLREPISKEEIEEINYSHKDAGIVSSINKKEEAEKRKKIYGMLWKVFVIVGFVDLGLSIFILLFNE